ncbi:MAG: AsmA family protein, partial [Proteobacteria bacterium]|nr:AsmA family protein [Pseudomonadota bacterium]
MKIKWIVTGLVALVVAVVVAGVAILSTMDFEELRGIIEAEAKEATGRELKIAGPIDLKISLTPAIAVEDVRFANAAWGSRADMISIRRFELEVALLPLLSGDIQVKRLVLIEPDILLETDQEGRGNWEMTGAAETGEKDGEAEGEDAPLPSFDQVVIRDATLTYKNGKTGEEIRLRLARLEGRAASASSPLEVALEGAYNDAPFKVEGTLGSFEQLFGEGPFPVKLSVEAGGATVTVDGRIAEPMTGRGLDLKIQVRGQSLADLGALGGVELPPLGPYDLSVQVEQEGTTYKLTGLTAKVGSSDIAGNATVAFGGARPAVNGSFTSGTLDLDDFAPPGAEGDGAAPTGAPAETAEQGLVFTEAPLPLDALDALDAKIKLSVKRLRLHVGLPLSDLDLSLVLEKGRLRVKPFSIGVAGGKLAGDFSIDAGKTPPLLTVKLSASGIDYGGLLKDFDVTDGVSGRLDAKVDLRGAGASLHAIAADLNGRIEVTGLTAKVGASDIAGNATIALGGPRPALSGSFTSGTLDLDDLARLGVVGTAGAPAGAPPKSAEQRFVFTEDPLPFEALDALDAKIELSVKRLRLREGLPLSNLALSLALKNRRLAVKPFSVDIAGGKLVGDFSLDAGKTPPPVAVNLSANGIDYGGLLKDLDVTDGVSGRLDAKVNLRG